MNNVALAERDRIVNSLRSCEDRAKQLFSLIRRHCPDVSSSSVYSPENGRLNFGLRRVLQGRLAEKWLFLPIGSFPPPEKRHPNRLMCFSPPHTLKYLWNSRPPAHFTVWPDLILRCVCDCPSAPSALWLHVLGWCSPTRDWVVGKGCRSLGLGSLGIRSSGFTFTCDREMKRQWRDTT